MTRLSILLILSLLTNAYAQSNSFDELLEGGNKGAYYYLRFNNIFLPLNNKGTIAYGSNPSAGSSHQEGVFEDGEFLFSGGFYLAGKHGSQIWMNGMAATQRDEYYVPGMFGTNMDNPLAGLYLVKSSDSDFHQSWLDWKEAVELGAHFYDGDGDGVYNPVDKNSNGLWDEDEDKPEILLDFSIWCVYNDGIPPFLGRPAGYDPLGIEIRQTLYGFETNGQIGNVIFIRYEILNTGIEHNQFDSVYFGAWADLDIGDYGNDLVGCDTILNAGFAYDNAYDSEYGNSPAFLIDILKSPAEQNQHSKEMTSFAHLYYPSPTMEPIDENGIWNILRGFRPGGRYPDPCTEVYGEVRGGVNCNDVPPQYFFSGDPVLDYGWICTNNNDQEMIVSTGPFNLPAGKTQTIEIAYVVGRDSTSLLSVNEAKRIDRIIQELYDNNFQQPAGPGAVKPIVEAEGEKINLYWETSEQFSYNEKKTDSNNDVFWDFRFGGYEVFMHRTPDLRDTVYGTPNKIMIAAYKVDDGIGDILIEDYQTGLRNIKYKDGTKLSPQIYSDSSTGRVRLSIKTDPFTGGKLIKGKPYYISINSYAINFADLQKVFPERSFDDTYVIPGNSVYGFVESSSGIINGSNGIVVGESINTPFREGIPLTHTAGASDALAFYNVIDRDLVENTEYEVTFTKDTSSYKYKLLWNVKNRHTGESVISNVDEFNQTQPIYIADGVMLSIEWLEPKLLDEEMKDGLDMWLKREEEQEIFQRKQGFGANYLGADIDTTMFAEFISNSKQSEIITFDKLRRVEIRFGQPSKAYRYIKRSNSIRYLSPDPNDPALGNKFVEVPFSAWVKDDRFGEEYQLATAFLEKMPLLGDTTFYNDEKWNPGHDISESTEYIVIFSTPYDPTGSNVVYTGTGTGASIPQKFADIGNGYRINREDPDFFITDSMAAIAESPWFDAMYLVALEVADSISREDFNPTGTYVININYPLTQLDKFTYTPSLELTNAEKKSLFEKVNVVPNPFFGYNDLAGTDPANQHVTFTNLPEEVTIKIYNLAGALVRTLNSADKSNEKSPFLKWDLRNENDFRVGSGMYLALVTSPGLGEKVLKFAVIQGEKYSKK